MADDEDDLHLQRASSAAVAKAIRELPKLVRNPSSARLTLILNQLEPFQGDPQLLDVHLKSLLPPVVAAYVKCVEEYDKDRSNVIVTSTALSKILYTLCKVRGESPIVGFFNNEPRHLEPFVFYFEQHGNGSLSWEERYILLLWLSHLTLAPFDLNTFSAEATEKLVFPHLSLPSDMPPIAIRVLRIALEHFSASAREMKAAAKLLTRLCIRPDMKQIRLPNAVIQWALATLKPTSGQESIESPSPSVAQSRVGILVFLSNLVATSTREVCAYLPQIYSAYQAEVEGSFVQSPVVSSSTISRRILTKLSRNIALLCLSPDADLGTDWSEIVEEVIGQLLESLGDKETPIRMAASKALSMITLKLPPEMAEEVIQSILDTFNVNIFRTAGSSQSDLAQVDPAQWHGLTLTLGHLLFRGAPPTSQLPEILKTLLLALKFEQRSPAGVSIGANVRDAANFGIWSLSRRYSPKELALVNVDAMKNSEEEDVPLDPSDSVSRVSPCVQQLLAVELLASACFDPTGNIRRGSSAALQELVGRHPDTILAGISLIQIVDYHTVGLRERAMVEVSSAAAALGEPAVYLEPLFRHLLGWRGVRSGDSNSRTLAAKAIGRMSKIHVEGLFKVIAANLEAINQREIERRHGLLLSLSALVDVQHERFVNEAAKHDEPDYQASSLQSLTNKTWDLFTNVDALRLSDRDFTSHTSRPELTTLAIMTLLTSLTQASAALHPSQTSSLDERLKWARLWLAEERKGSSRMAIRQSGYVLALSAAFPHIDEYPTQKSIIETLCKRCSSDVEVEARVVALKAIKWVLDGKGRTSQETWRTAESTPTLPQGELGRQVVQAILTGLNDYTINERGDVGSLVRLQALETLDSLPRKIRSDPDYEGLHEALCAASRRLSVEKLDKVRLKASESFLAVPRQPPDPPSLQSISSYDHFRQVIRACFWGQSQKIAASVLEGFVTSAGGGASENIVQNSRAALFDVLDEIWRDSANASQPTFIAVCTMFVDALRDNLDNERVLTALLDTLGFLFDAGLLQRLPSAEFKWRTLLSLIQKSHYKSSSIPKILTAINCYRGLAEIDTVREDALKKLRSMLKHPFPKVRDATVETLFVLIHDEKLRTFVATR
ncbi:MAG: hypothetical protein M1822_006225 [Bathelium mastoideum]|nr:MAG: hypothetical protein M1822_006225 [Bathelium mastoideum]